MRITDRLPLLAGPLVLAGFYLPLVRGHGLLTGNAYNGYDLMQFSAWLGAADATGGEWLLLMSFRIAAAALVVAGIWLTLTAPALRDHVAYHLAGTYAAAGAFGAVAFALYWNGAELPQPGVFALVAGAAAWAAPGLARLSSRRPTSRVEAAAISASTGS